MKTIHSSAFKNSFSLEANAHIHLMGICGTAMASLAGLLQKLNYQISGSDTSYYPPMSNLLEEMNIVLYENYTSANLNLNSKDKPDLVIIGNVIRKEYEEAIALLDSDIFYMSLPEAIGQFVIEDRQSIVVAGTHGKTTTTSLLSWVAEVCQKQPGFLIGGIAENFQKSFQLPKSDLFIIEGDEYDTVFYDKVPKFIYYRPFVSVITSIEFDHADIYKNLDEIKKVFSRLLELTSKEGGVIVHAEDKNVADVLRSFDKNNILTYGLTQGDYTARDIKSTKDLTIFTVFKHDKKLIEIASSLFGDYNILNILATVATADFLSWPLDKVKQGLSSFEGIKRRQEIIGQPNNIVVIEDFAHHPTAVKMTISAISKRFVDKNIFVVFEPRSATSRRKVFQEAYLEAFSINSKATYLISKPFNQDGIKEENRFSAELLIKELTEKKIKAYLMQSNQDIISFLKTTAKSNDAILIMSNGDFNGIYKELLLALE